MKSHGSVGHRKPQVHNGTNYLHGDGCRYSDTCFKCTQKDCVFDGVHYSKKTYKDKTGREKGEAGGIDATS